MVFFILSYIFYILQILFRIVFMSVLLIRIPVQWVPVFSGGKERPGRDVDPSPPSSAVFNKE